MASLLERCSELKRQLVEFACSPPFSGQLDQALNENATGPAASEAGVTNVVDHFILQQPLADGRTVAEVFAAEHPDLSDDDRQVLRSWREVLAGAFEIRQQTGDSITATSLGDDRTYRIRANAGPAALGQFGGQPEHCGRFEAAYSCWAPLSIQSSPTGTMRAVMKQPAASAPQQRPHLLWSQPGKHPGVLPARDRGHRRR